MSDPKIIPLEGDSEIEIETDADGNRVNLDPALMPPAKTTEIYPPLKKGQKI